MINTNTNTKFAQYQYQSFEVLISLLPPRSLRDTPFPPNLCTCSTSLSKMGTYAAPRGRGALEEMGTYPRHVLYFSRKFYLRQFDFVPKNQNFDPSCFYPIQKLGVSTRGLTGQGHFVTSHLGDDKASVTWATKVSTKWVDQIDQLTDIFEEVSIFVVWIGRFAPFAK